MIKFFSTLFLMLFFLLSYGQTKTEFTDDRNGHEYKIVKFGDQIWMAENLSYLESGSETSYYGYNDSIIGEESSKDYFTMYGCLYDWGTAQNVCPTGWHLPSDEEWMMLESHLGMNSVIVNAFGWRYSGDVSSQLTESKTFAALPGGFRKFYQNKITYKLAGEAACFWTSTINGGKAYSREISNKYNAVGRITVELSDARSVRCLKD